VADADDDPIPHDGADHALAESPPRTAEDRPAAVEVDLVEASHPFANEPFFQPLLPHTVPPCCRHRIPSVVKTDVFHHGAPHVHLHPSAPAPHFHGAHKAGAPF